MDAAKLEHLKEMMAADNYKENLGTLIRYGPGCVNLRGTFGGNRKYAKTNKYRVDNLPDLTLFQY